MIIKSHASEKGQAIVFLVVGLVVFLGFVALAIDGGMAYADRRYAQNSSDAASLAGGGEAALYLENNEVKYSSWDCNDPDVVYAEGIAITEAIQRAANNGFSIDGDIGDGNGVVVACGATDYGFFVDKYMDVTVNISTTTETSFAHLLFPEVLHIQVHATTRIRPRQPWVLGNSVVALNPENCSGHQNGGVYYGNGNVFVSGGGIWTNGCLQGNGRPSIIVDPGGIAYGGDFDPGNASWSPEPPPDPTGYHIPPSQYAIDPPNCTGRWVDGLNGTIDPGLYCLHGDLRVNANHELVGHDVTIYVEGDIVLNGSALIQLSAPDSNPDPAPALGGVLFYIPHMPGANCADQTFDMNGNSDSYFQGIILAPCADITVNGTGNVNAYQTQIIGWNVLVGGTADTSVIFNREIFELRPTYIELFR